MENRVKNFTSIRNFRDFGGYSTHDGGMIRTGKLYRSGNYSEATPEELEQVKSLNIAFQVDLRRPDERERMVAKWSAPYTITHDGGRESEAPHVQFLKQVEVDKDEAESWMINYYKKAPFRTHHIELFRCWFDGLLKLEDDEAALVNCTAGKDRTGLLCAFTKHALGVDEETLIEDYLLTNTAANVKERLSSATVWFNKQIKQNYTAEVYWPFIGVRAIFFKTALETITLKTGSLSAYLEDVIGLKDEDIKSLRKHFVIYD